MWGLILSILIAIIIAAFATLNNAPVSVNLFLWQAPKISLALVVLISVLVGVVIAALFGSPQYIKTAQQIKELEKKTKELEGSPAQPETSEVKNEAEKEQTPPQN